MKFPLTAFALTLSLASSSLLADPPANPIPSPNLDPAKYALTLDTAPSDSQPAPPANDNPFTAGRWSLSLAAGYSASFNSNRRENLTLGFASIGYTLVDNLQLMAEIPGYFVSQQGPDTGAGGLNLMLRYHFLRFDKFSLFAEGGAGFLLSPKPVPTGGTYFNFIPQGGLGLTYNLSGNLFLIAGARLDHISNAGIRGSAHNPSMNLGVESYAGLMFMF